MNDNKISVEKVNNFVTIIRIAYEHGDEFPFFLSSDHHADSVKCEREILRNHLEESKERGAKNLFFGDTYDLMQGRHDRRSAPEDLKDEYKRSDYLDAVSEDVADFYRPYAENTIGFGLGNHETSVIKNTGHNPLNTLIDKLSKENPNIMRWGYRGFIFFRFEHVNGGGRFTKKLYFHHGSGGTAPVTKGVLKTGRRSVYLPDADIICTGHTHNEWYFPLDRLRVNSHGKVYYDKQIHLQLPSYKRDGDGKGPPVAGWAVESEFSPQGIGSWFIKFKVANGKATITPEPITH
ncbi:hypothetical protein ACKGJO_06640 [Gracilimonas sp. Q87]|uniref:hypothetical protein n=1 Tax=Gracilimonas sp. Q87 TaxID=3384766 RepID=UPI0039844EE1